MIYKFSDYKKSVLLENHLNLGGRNPSGERIDVTSLYLTRGGKPWIAVMGEYHFVRASRNDWYTELCKMKAGGITTIATYLFWIYHEETEGEFDFSGDLDIRFFAEECKRAGLDLVIRIGPWAHGECRNGGFPDWLLKKPFKLRDNNTEYMVKVRVWYEKIYEQVHGLFYKDGGNIIGIQLENELVDDSDHLLALKELAAKIGYDVPIYTVTGWNSAYGARIPENEVLPVFGAYPEAPWENHTEPLKPSGNFMFNRMRNDTAIGVDLIRQTSPDGWRLPYGKYPFATCELGCGIQVTHHRRPIITPMDAYALSLVKLGSGNNLIGYYMYHGGTNKIGRLSTFNESKATGYPNDYPILSYDFQTALSEYGEVRGQYRLLNLLHMFVQDFGELLAPMEAVDSTNSVAPDDFDSLRIAMRRDENSGFVFINHHARLNALTDIYGAVIDTGDVIFPAINVCGDISFFLPFNMPLGSQKLVYSTAQPICRDGNTYIFAAIDGINPEYLFENGEKFTAPEFIIGGIKIITLTFEQALYLRKLSGKIYIGNGFDLYEKDGEIRAISDGDYSYKVYENGSFCEKSVQKPFKQAKLSFEDIAEPFEPKYSEELNIGGERIRKWKKISVTDGGGFVEINFPCDAAQIYKNGKMIADTYYYGKPWRIPASLLSGGECYFVMSEMRDDFYREF